MDDESGDDNRDELTGEWGGESRHDWRGWRKESGSWFHRRVIGDVQHSAELQWCILRLQESDLGRLRNAREAEIVYQREQNELEVTKTRELADIETDKFKNMVDAVGTTTLQAIATAGPDTQVCPVSVILLSYCALGTRQFMRCWSPSLLVKFVKHNQNYYLKLDVFTSIRGLHQKNLVLSSFGSWHDGKTPCQESGRMRGSVSCHYHDPSLSVSLFVCLLPRLQQRVFYMFHGCQTLPSLL